jgi:hypothetical protein
MRLFRSFFLAEADFFVAPFQEINESLTIVRLLVSLFDNRPIIAIYGQWMRLEPQLPSFDHRINSHLKPPDRFVPAAMNLAMMSPAKGNREFIAHLAADDPPSIRGSWGRVHQRRSARFTPHQNRCSATSGICRLVKDEGWREDWPRQDGQADHQKTIGSIRVTRCLDEG